MEKNLEMIIWNQHGNLTTQEKQRLLFSLKKIAKAVTNVVKAVV